MKKLFSLLFITGSILTAQAQQEEPYVTKTFKSANLSLVDVSTSGGGITVEGGHPGEARVEAYIRNNNSRRELTRNEIAERLENYDFSIENQGGVVKCVAKRKGGLINFDWERSLSISFKLYVPTRIDTELNTSGGGITMKNLHGNLRFATSGGGLTLQDLKGDVAGRTSGGGIKIENCDDRVKVSTSGGGISGSGCDGDIDLRTSGGGIRLANMSGNLRAVTSGGGVTIQNSRGTIYTTTSGGSMTLEGISGTLEASTSGGGITAHISDIKNSLSLSSSAGSIRVDLPKSAGMDLDVRGNRVDFSGFSSFNGSNAKGTLRGSVNGGGANVRISTSAGNVTIL